MQVKLKNEKALLAPFPFFFYFPKITAIALKNTVKRNKLLITLVFLLKGREKTWIKKIKEQ